MGMKKYLRYSAQIDQNTDKNKETRRQNMILKDARSHCFRVLGAENRPRSLRMANQGLGTAYKKKVKATKSINS